MSQRGQIIDRGPNRWLVRATLGRDPKTGRRRLHSKTVHGTKREAQQYLTKVLREIDEGAYVHQSRVTVREALDDWLDTVARQRVSERTLRDYRRNLERYIYPALGERRLQALRPFEIQKVYAEMIDRELSPRTVRAAHAPLHSALENAVRWRLIPQNPSKLVDLPKIVRAERRVLSAEEARTFLDHAAEDRHGTLWAVLLTTGLRPGEALGLQWRDLEDDRLRIRRSLKRRSDGGWELSAPKTPQSRRSVTLPGTLVRTLSGHRAGQARGRLKIGAEYEDHDLIFCTSRGTPLDLPNITRRYFYPLLERAGLPRIRVYDLRHTCATLLLAANAHPKVVSERLGHSSVTLTLDTYSHVLPSMQAGPADQLEGMLFG